MKTIRVVAAVICDSIENPTRIFATARGYGDFKGGWEFPGGKIEPGEKPEEAVVREIREELDATVKVGELIDTIEYDYPNFHLSMDCFWCEVESGQLRLLEAEAAKWLIKDELDTVNWLPADVTILEKIREKMDKTGDTMTPEKQNEQLKSFLAGTDFMRLGHAIETGNQQTAIMIVNGMQRQLAEVESNLFARELINIKQCIANGAKADALDILALMTVKRIQLQKELTCDEADSGR